MFILKLESNLRWAEPFIFLIYFSSFLSISGLRISFQRNDKHGRAIWYKTIILFHVIWEVGFLMPEWKNMWPVPWSFPSLSIRVYLKSGHWGGVETCVERTKSSQGVKAACRFIKIRVYRPAPSRKGFIALTRRWAPNKKNARLLQHLAHYDETQLSGHETLRFWRKH